MPVPGQEFDNAPRRMVGDAGEHIGEVVRRSRLFGQLPGRNKLKGGSRRLVC